MKFIVALSPTETASPEVSEAWRAPSVKMVWDLYLQGVVREMYARADGTGVIFIAEATDAHSLRTLIEAWPLVREGQIAGDVIGLAPFSQLALAFQSAPVAQ